MPEKKVKILLDLPVEDGVLGFDNYRDALINVIKGSEPRFTIGIFGGWGTGKTTLMRMMKKKLDDEKEVTVWFNPWEYEKEEHLIIPLLQTIYLELKNQDLLKSETITNFGKVILSLVAGLSATFPAVGVGISPKDAIETYQKLFESKNLSSLYFELRQQLSEIIKELKAKEKSRIIMFIDDLDRCLPDKALQVLESIKGFLDMDGYVSVLGLSRDIIEKCVDKKYGKESGISGTDYIKKIIQVSFNLPELREQEVKTYVQRLKEQLKGTEVEEYVEKYIDIISKGMEANPREIKRFINNFILVNQISVGETEPDKLLVLLIIQFRWEEFYRAIAEHKAEFLASVFAYLEEDRDVRSDEARRKFQDHWGHLDLIEKMLNNELKTFLKDQVSIISGINNLDSYIHFSKAGKIPEPGRPKIHIKEEFITLLKAGNTQGFNKIRPYPSVDLRRSYLSQANLERADLSRADLRGANLREVYLRLANLSGAYLGSANLTEANLVGADLSKAHLCGANLSRIIIDEDTIFRKTIIQDVKNLTPNIRETLYIEMEDGVEKATSKRLLGKK